MSHSIVRVTGVTSVSPTDRQVVKRRSVSDCMIALTLQAATGEPLPSWDRGARIDVLLPNGLIRQYSQTAAACHDGHWRIAVLRETGGRGGSVWIHDNVDTGVTLRIRGPRNNFELSSARRYMFIAGGVGITPLWAMAAALDARGAHWRMVYGGRSRCSLAFLDELARFGEKVQISPADECDLLDLPAIPDAPAFVTLVYCCGPRGLVEAVESGRASWPSGSLRVESFRRAEQRNAGTVDQLAVVELRSSGLTLRVPAGKSILAAIEEADRAGSLMT